MADVLLLAGVDEVGRGPLAGPVTAAAVILDPKCPVVGLKDSKRLSQAQRERLAQQIQQTSLAWALGWADVREIDTLNILQASLLAMQRAVAALSLRPEAVWVDGNQLPAWNHPSQAIVGGDAQVPAISAASIIAKVARDNLMQQWDSLYPGYGLAQHKGYPTAAHLAALRRLGPSAIHRRSFAPVAALLTP